MRSSRRGVASVLVASVLVAACSVSPSPSPTPSGSAALGSPSASTPSPSGPTGELPRPLAWVQAGAVGTTGRIGSLLAFDGGYVGWQDEGEEGFPVAWHSADGVTWTRSELAKPVSPCPGWTVRPDGEVTWGATNGSEVILVGLEYDPDSPVCGTWRAAAWVTSDGRSWRRAPGFGAIGVDNNGWAHAVWARPGGWEAALIGAGGFTQIWQSTDGLQWNQVAAMAQNDQVGYSSYASDLTTGTRVIVEFDGEDGTSRLLVTQDGRNWPEAAGFPVDRSISQVLAPDSSAPYWTVVTTDEESNSSEVWVSPDLENWQSAPFPMPVAGTLAHIPDGLLTVGIDPCRDTGGPCDVAPPRYFLSSNGLAWTALDTRVSATQFTDGPAGVLGVGEEFEEGKAQLVWRLDRYSADEAYLLAGLRSDARFACAPRRTALPAGAVAAVECSPESPDVDAIGVFLFTDQDKLLSAYFATLTNYDVLPRSGSCPRTAGEIAYVPGDDGATFEPHRYGCFVNEFGNANYRFTTPDSFVYVGILGTDRNMTNLHEWAWVGNQDQPGEPTVWRQPNP